MKDRFQNFWLIRAELLKKMVQEDKKTDPVPSIYKTNNRNDLIKK